MTAKYLTFDCYGTLIDWKKGIENSLESALGGTALQGKALLDAYVSAEMQEERRYKKYREVLRRSALRLSDAVGKKMSSEAAGTFSESVPLWPAFPDTGRFLSNMRAAGYKLFILSNVDTDLLEGTIRNWKLGVDGFVTAEEVGSYKPNPAHWVRFMEKTGARKGEILHVAQSVFHDILPTQTLGIRAAWVNRYREPMPDGLRPAFVSDNLANLGKLLVPDVRKA